MNLLAVDTSGPVAGVAVLKDGEVAYEVMKLFLTDFTEEELKKIDQCALSL